MCPEKTTTERDTCTPGSTAALFAIAGTWKQPRCPSTDEWIQKLWYTYTVDCYSARWMDIKIVVHIYNGLLLSFKKEHIWVSPNEANKSTAYGTKWSKSEREGQILCISTCVWNLERCHWWTYLQGGSGDADREQTCGNSVGGEGGTDWESSMETWHYGKWKR